MSRHQPSRSLKSPYETFNDYINLIDIFLSKLHERFAAVVKRDKCACFSRTLSFPRVRIPIFDSHFFI